MFYCKQGFFSKQLICISLVGFEHLYIYTSEGLCSEVVFRHEDPALKLH